MTWIIIVSDFLSDGRYISEEYAIYSGRVFSDVKSRFCNRNRISINDELEFRLNGEILDLNKTVKELGIVDDCIIHVTKTGLLTKGAR